MTPPDTLTTLFRHHLWANTELFTLCAGLTPEQLDAQVVGGYGSLRDTLEHIVLAERHYLSRVSTGEPYRRPEDDPPLTPEAMLASIRQTGEAFLEWIDKVGPNDTYTADLEDGPRVTPKTIVLAQVINHATEHRVHVMVILTQLGIQPPENDLWMYFDTY
jgi:uncharacterized damage-inducible protein DinB